MKLLFIILCLLSSVNTLATCKIESAGSGLLSASVNNVAFGIYPNRESALIKLSALSECNPKCIIAPSQIVAGYYRIDIEGSPVKDGIGDPDAAISELMQFRKLGQCR